MKKLIVTILSLTLITAMAGCQKEKETETDVTNIKEVESSISETDIENNESVAEEVTESSEKATDATSNTEDVKITDVTTTKKITTARTETQTQIKTEIKIEESIAETVANDENSKYTDIANAVYNDAVSMYAEVILNCPYRLDYENVDLNGLVPISDPSVKSVEDVAAFYCTVFSHPDSYIYERYIEKDGIVYCNDTARGSNIYYSGTDFEFVSEEGNTLTFNAVSHYSNPDTGEAMVNEIAKFSIIKTDNGYRVSEFDYPQ